MFKTFKGDIYGHAFWSMHYANPDSDLLIPAVNALQMMSIPAGESSCERAISRCRHIIGDYKSNESEELSSARILAGIASSKKYGKYFEPSLDLERNVV